MTSRKRQHSTETNKNDTNLLLHDTNSDNDNDNNNDNGIDEKKQAAAPRWWQRIIRRRRRRRRRQSPTPTTTWWWWWSHPTSRRQQLPLRSVRNDHCKQQQQQQQDEKGSLGVVVRLVVVVPGTVVVIVLLMILHRGVANHFVHPLSTITHMPALDFVVAGFPKCGTTTLLYAFRQQQQSDAANNNILMSSREVCAVKDKRRREAIVQERYRRELKHAWNIDTDDNNDNNNNNNNNEHGNLQKGIKCPTIVYSDKAIERLLTWHNHTSSFVQQQQQNEQEQDISRMTRQEETPLRWIIGMRHPMHQVQSYYNYLVTEVYDKGYYWWYKGIPSLESILLPPDGGGVPWKDMTADTHRYEIHLERLLSRLLVLHKQQQQQQQQREQQQQRQNDGDDVAAEDMIHHHHNPWVFLYTLEQMQDGEEAMEALQRDLSTFVGTPRDTTLVLGHENVNRFTGAAGHPETIYLCREQFAPLRAKLLRDSQQTADWMQDFVLSVKSPYFDLLQLGGGVSALRTYVQTWKRDICD